MFWRVYVSTSPVEYCFAWETTEGKAMCGHLETRAPWAESPVVDAMVRTHFG